MLWIMVDAAQFNPADTAEDQITWTRSADGNYSAKSAYLMQFDGGVESSLPATVWQVWAPTRCKVFMRLMLQNKVWTADRLLAREWQNEYFLPQPGDCRTLNLGMPVLPERLGSGKSLAITAVFRPKAFDAKPGSLRLVLQGGRGCWLGET
jgi:hypothetical protein